MADRISERPMAIPRREYTRGQFLKGLGAVGAVTAAAGLTTAAGYGIGQVGGKVIGEIVTQQSREKYSQIQAQAKEWLAGDLIVKSEAIARNQTAIGQNLVDRGMIKKINGKEVDATGGIKLTNVPLTEGGEPEGRFGKGNWYPLLATMSNPFSTWEEVIYFPTGGQAEQNGIVPDRDHGARFYPVRSRERDAIILENGTKEGLRIPKDKIGLVEPLKTK